MDNDCKYFEQVQQSAAIDDGGSERIQSLMEMVSQVQHHSSVVSLVTLTRDGDHGNYHCDRFWALSDKA